VDARKNLLDIAERFEPNMYCGHSTQYSHLVNNLKMFFENLQKKLPSLL